MPKLSVKIDSTEPVNGALSEGWGWKELCLC